VIEFDRSARELVIDLKGAKAIGVSAPADFWGTPMT
jgi:hypothetical protein